MERLKDRWGREITYLRISLTDRCNLKCFYCRPKKIFLKPRRELLSFEEIERITKILVKMGIEKVRFTGGEPLLRRGIVTLVEKVVKIPGLKEVSLTTNGTLLSLYAPSLSRAGLSRVNVSLDTLRRKKYRYITGEDKFLKVWEGIEKAEEWGLTPLKINMVVIRGINEDEILEFASLTLERPWEVRFIELMPFTSSRYSTLFVGEEKIKAICSRLGKLVPLPFTGAPPQRYRIEGAKGTLGFISPLSRSFCSFCNRIRLTPEGRLRLCLGEEKEEDLRELLKEKEERVKRRIKNIIVNKPSGHSFLPFGEKKISLSMWRVGG